MRRVLASLYGVSLGMAILLPTAAAAPSEAPSASARSSESPQPSGSVSRSESPASPEPVSRDAHVSVSTEVTTDGTFWEDVAGWQYGIAVTDGSTDRDAVTSRESFTVTIPGESATVRITETLQVGLKLRKASCEEPDQDPFTPGALGTLDGATLSFDAKPGGDYTCRFVNAPPVLPDARVSIWKLMDADGDLETPDDFPLGVGWDFSIGVTNGTASRTIVTTDKNGVATFTVTAFARLSITEIDSSDLLAGGCWDIWGDDPIHGGYTQDGATFAFDTEPSGVYGCEFMNQGVGVKAETQGPAASAPPTDVLGGTPEPSGPWRSVVIALAGLTAGVLVLKSPRSRS